jgi:hypothetical protein
MKKNVAYDIEKIQDEIELGEELTFKEFFSYVENKFCLKIALVVQLIYIWSSSAWVYIHKYL